ncbi:MAG: glycosyltransferase [Clostridiales bacterium]|nr:glycosyltransferase [Clostridiales bacterium]
MSEISVIVPVYNGEKYIRETFDCLVSQTHGDLEVIVVNDGSTDGTQAIIDEYSGKYDFFVPVYQDNAGVSAARNNGLERATGDFVLFLDSDDVLTPGSLEAFDKALNETGSDVAICRLQSFGAAREVYNEYADRLSGMKNIDIFDKNLLWNFLVGNKCYRRSALVDSGVKFPLLRYSEEGAFFFEFIMTGVKITGTTDACMRYRRHSVEDESVSQSISFGLFDDFTQSLARVYAASKKALENSPLSEKEREDYLQEVLYKTDFILLMQFYPLIRRADDKTIKAMGEEHERLCGLMNEEKRNAVGRLFRNLGKPVFDKKELAAHPEVSVIFRGRKLTDEFLYSLYRQRMPAFELIVRGSAAKGSGAIAELIDNGNLIIIDDKGFASAASKAAKGRYVLNIHRPEYLDPRLLGLLLQINRVPPKLKKMFFRPLSKAAEVLLKIKG